MLNTALSFLASFDSDSEEADRKPLMQQRSLAGIEVATWPWNRALYSRGYRGAPNTLVFIVHMWLLICVSEGQSRTTSDPQGHIGSALIARVHASMSGLCVCVRVRACMCPAGPQVITPATCTHCDSSRKRFCLAPLIAWKQQASFSESHPVKR